MHDEWLSLREASAFLGVHPSTLRRWSDQGRVDSVRSAGGHRRFNRAALEGFLLGQHSPAGALRATELAAQPGPPPSLLVLPDQPSAAAGGAGATGSDLNQPWRDSFPAEDREVLRQLGQRLLGLMLQYLTRRDEDERFLREGRSIGRRYGAEIAKAGLAMLQTVEAFLYFRSQFTEMALALPAFPRPGDEAESRRLHVRVDRFLNEVLLGTIEGWELSTGADALSPL